MQFVTGWLPGLDRVRQVDSKRFNFNDFKEPEHTDRSLFYPLKGGIN